MRNSTLLCRRDLLWIALQARIFGAARVEWKHAFTMPSRDKNNLKVNPNYNLKENLQLEFFICVFRVFRGLLSSDLRRNLYGKKSLRKS